VRRIDLLGVDEVPDGTMKMAWAEGTDPVLVVHTGGELTAVQGTCSHESFELDQGFLTAGTLTCALPSRRPRRRTPAELPLASRSSWRTVGTIECRSPARVFE
jgi:hypothetical protein